VLWLSVLLSMLKRVTPRQLNIQRAFAAGRFQPSTSTSTSTKRIFPATMPPTERAEKQAAAQQAVDILHEIATILVSLANPAHQH
jgi:hypothetical protein